MLKKWMLIGICAILLTGCASPTFETLGDIPHHQVAAAVPREVVLELPEEAVLSVWKNEADTMYLCWDFSVHLQTLEAGDLQGSIRQLCGYDRANLTVVESCCGDHSRYEWVWIAAGEGGDEIYRCALLDDGDFHYALTLTASSDTAGALSQTWNEIMASFCLEEKT